MVKVGDVFYTYAHTCGDTPHKLHIISIVNHDGRLVYTWAIYFRCWQRWEYFCGDHVEYKLTTNLWNAKRLSRAEHFGGE